MKKIKKESGI